MTSPRCKQDAGAAAVRYTSAGCFRVSLTVGNRSHVDTLQGIRQSSTSRIKQSIRSRDISHRDSTRRSSIASLCQLAKSCSTDTPALFVSLINPFPSPANPWRIYHVQNRKIKNPVVERKVLVLSPYMRKEWQPCDRAQPSSDVGLYMIVVRN